MTVYQIEFDAKFTCEAYAQPGESIPHVLFRGDFQHTTPCLLRYRTFELTDDGEETNFGEWIEGNNVFLSKFTE